MSGRKPLIAVDCDDVLVNLNDGIREFVNEVYGMSHTSDDYRVSGPYRGYWDKIWGMPDGERSGRLEEFIDSGRMGHLEPVPGVLETLARLNQGYDLALVTARSDKEVDITKQWLDTYAPRLFSHVTFMHLWDEPTAKATKAKICQQLGAKFLIDDNYSHCELAAGVGVETLLFGDYGWNRDGVELAPNITRVFDWPAVEDYFHGAR